MNKEGQPDQPELLPAIYHAADPTVQKAADNVSEPDQASRTANAPAGRSSRPIIKQRGADPALMEFARDLAAQDGEGVVNRYRFDPTDGSVTVLNKPRRPRGQQLDTQQEERQPMRPLVLPQGVIDAVIEEVAGGDEELAEVTGTSITIHNQPPSPKKAQVPKSRKKKK